MNRNDMNAGVVIMLVGLVLTILGFGTGLLPQGIGALGIFVIGAGVAALFYFKK